MKWRVNQLPHHKNKVFQLVNMLSQSHLVKNQNPEAFQRKLNWKSLWRSCATKWFLHQLLKWTGTLLFNYMF